MLHRHRLRKRLPLLVLKLEHITHHRIQMWRKLSKEVMVMSGDSWPYTSQSRPIIDTGGVTSDYRFVVIHRLSSSITCIPSHLSFTCHGIAFCRLRPCLSHSFHFDAILLVLSLICCRIRKARFDSSITTSLARARFLESSE